MEKITLGPMPYMSVMPAVLVDVNVRGKPNSMAAAWATVACTAPPMVCVAINKARYTAKGIDKNKTFSLNVPSVKQVIETAHCGLVSGAQGGHVSSLFLVLRETEDRPDGRGVPGHHRMQALQIR